LLDTYTTTVSDVLDLALIVPTLFVAAALVRRRAALGHIFAAALIVLIVLITATIIAGTMLQTRAGLSFAVGQVVGPIAEFSSCSAPSASCYCYACCKTRPPASARRRRAAQRRMTTLSAFVSAARPKVS